MRIQLLFFTLILTIISACGSEEGAMISAVESNPSGDTEPPQLTIQQPADNSTLNTTNITISGTAGDNRALAGVYLCINSAPFAEVEETSGSWSTNITLPEGVYSVSVYAMDTNGNCSTTNSHAFTIALDAPAVFVTAPANGSFTNSVSIAVSGTASVNSGAITGVEVKAGSGSYASASSSDSWTNWNSTLSLSDGANTITARVSSDSGKQSEASITITLDTTPPEITSISPKNNTNRFRSDESIHFNISSGSDTSGIRRIVVLKDGAEYTNKTVSTGSLNSERIFVAALNTVGTCQFGFYLVDGAGNPSPTNTISVTTYCEPELRYNTPSANSCTAALSTTVSGTATIDIGSISLVRVKAGTNGSWVAATSSDGFATWNANLPLAAGTNNIHIEAVSDAGITAYKTIYNVYSDRTPPTAAITGPAEGFSIEHNKEFMIQATSSEDVNNIGVSTLVVLTNGSVLTTINSPSSTESITCPGFAAGSHTISVYSINGVGLHSSTNSITVNVTEPFFTVDSICWKTYGELLINSTLTRDATVYYIVVDKGYIPDAQQVKAGVDYTTSGKNVAVWKSGSSPGYTGSNPFYHFFTLPYTYPAHVYCVAQTSGGLFSKVRFAGTFRRDSTNILPAMETLIFSEYICGNGNNKALEIYNGTGKPVDLGNYTIELYLGAWTSPQNHGEGWILGNSGTFLGQGETWVFANKEADPAILAKTNKVVGSLDFNGNDTLRLINAEGMVIDSFGKFKENPEDPDCWTGTNGMQTMDRTLRRRLSVRRGDTDPDDTFDPDVEWICHPNGTFDGLGSWQE